MASLTILLGAVLARNVFSQSGHLSLVSQQLLVLLLWFFLHSPVERGFITINQNYKSGISHLQQAHPRRWEETHFYSLAFVMPGCGNNRTDHTAVHVVPAKRAWLSKCSPPAPASPSLWSQWPGAKMVWLFPLPPLPDLLPPYSPLIPVALREQPLSLSQGVLPLPSGAAFLLFQA